MAEADAVLLRGPGGLFGGRVQPDEMVDSCTGGRLTAPLHVANDRPPLPDVTVEVTLAGETTVVRLGSLPGWSATAAGSVDLPVPAVPGPHDVALRLLSGDRVVADGQDAGPASAAPGWWSEPGGRRTR